MRSNKIDRRQFLQSTTVAAGAAAVGLRSTHLLTAAERRIGEPELLARGATKVYRDDYLEAISLPVGGIGAGPIQLNGKAERHVWQIFNNTTQGVVYDSFFAVRARRTGDEPVVRALQTTEVGPFAAMAELSFRGEYPFGWFDFSDDEVPLEVGMEVFSPLIPLQERDSAMPCAVFNLTAENTGRKPVEVSFLAAQQNAVGYIGEWKIEDLHYRGCGGNVNRILREGGATILHMTMEPPNPSWGWGDMALAVLSEDATFTAEWTDEDELLRAWQRSGDLNGPDSAGPTPPWTTFNGALALSFTLEPGAKRTVPVILTWYFPNIVHGLAKYGWNGDGNRYTKWWADALAVARDVRDRFDELSGGTRLFHDTFYASNLPHWLLDRLTSQLAVLRSKTCYWTEKGYFGGWEGCTREQGCCHGNCSHVWHYAQSHARLYPGIARSMREQALRWQRANGSIPFRQPQFSYACDGQLGEVLEAYREHLTSTDGGWLKTHWPKIKRAMEFVITRWDPDEDGVLGGQQHNTHDAELSGSSSWLGTLYLAALAACERMARLENESAAEQRFLRIRERGASAQNRTLWNGSYYIQIPDAEPGEDYNNGCHMDQVLGQWWAHQLDLGWLYPPERVRSAMQALLKHNFRDNFHGHHQLPRRFADDDDAGMLITTWPQDDRPEKYVRYADEVWTGFEYAVAATMIQAGMLTEGLMVARAPYDRYDGRLRTGMAGAENGRSSWGYNGNPFGDDECGKFYARAMSVWSILLACQGFVYDGPAGTIGFRPVWQPADHASFFSAAEGWGLYTQRRDDRTQRHRIQVTSGSVTARRLEFEVARDADPETVEVTVDGQEVSSEHARVGRRLTIHLDRPITVTAGQTVAADVRFAG
jgi:uncharacterized protein (DUF608 family)